MHMYIDNLDEKSLCKLLNDVLDTSAIGQDYLSSIQGRELILYGAGSLGAMAVDLMKPAEIMPKYIIDRNSDKWGSAYKGIEIVSPEKISDMEKDTYVFGVSIVNYPYEEVVEYLKGIGCRHILPFYDIAEYYGELTKMTNGWFCGDLSDNEKEVIRKVYNGFFDIASKAMYLQVLYWRILRTEIIFKDLEITIDDKLFPRGIMPELHDNESFVDCGAYEGKSIKDFMSRVNGSYQEITAFEPDQYNFEILHRYVDGLDDKYKSKINIYQCGVGEKPAVDKFLSGRGMAGRFDKDSEGVDTKIVTIDEMFDGKSLSLLKLHVEGSEYAALKGGNETIKRCRPIINVTLYHSREGLFEIPQYLMESLQNYVFYHRIHGYCGTESFLYAFPKERKHE